VTFVATFPLRFDEKWRFFLPTKWRDDLADGFYLVQGHEDCVAIYSQSGFEKLAALVQSESTTFEDVRAYQRMLGADASEAKADGQGRVIVPPALREYASLDRDIIVTGAIDHGEIWNPQRWEQYRTAQLPQYSKINKQIGQPQGGAK